MIATGSASPAVPDAPTTDLVPYDAAPSAATQDLAILETRISDIGARDRAAWFGTAAIALGAVASNTCKVPPIGIVGGFAAIACGVSIAALIFIGVGSVIQGLFGQNKRGLDSFGPDYLQISGLQVERGSEFDIQWHYPDPFTSKHLEMLEAHHDETGAPLLFAESHCNEPHCANLWYSHTRNATGEGGIRRRINVTRKGTSHSKRQDHETDKSNDQFSGGYVWDEHDSTTLYSISTDDHFARDVVQQMVDQNGGQGTSGKFGRAGIYCMDLDTDERMTPVGSDGYLWYYEDPR